MCRLTSYGSNVRHADLSDGVAASQLTPGEVTYRVAVSAGFGLKE